MNRFKFCSIAVLLTSASVLARADAFTYPVSQTPGSIVAPTNYITATGGNILAQFVGTTTNAKAGFSDTVGIYDETTGTYQLSNLNSQSTAIGATYNFGAYTAGDVLSVGIFTSPNSYYPNGVGFGSDPKLMNPDGQNHAYVRSFAGGTIQNVLGDSTSAPFQFMAGTFFGVDDYQINPNSNPNGYTNYNDADFILSGVTATQTPEPSSLLLLGTGALAVAGAARRRVFGR